MTTESNSNIDLFLEKHVTQELMNIRMYEMVQIAIEWMVAPPPTPSRLSAY